MTDFKVIEGDVTLYDGDGDETGVAAKPLRVDPTGDTAQPVEQSDASKLLATVKITDGSENLAIDGDGNIKAVVRGGAKGTTTAADVTSTAEGADHQALDVQIMHGGAAVNPTAIRALTSADVVTANQGTAAATAGAWPIKLTDGTDTADIDAQGHVLVAGKSALGVAPSAPPVSVGGVDGGGLKRNLLLDTDGRPQANVAQWLGSTAPTVGQKTMANSVPVVMASNQTPLPITFSSGTAGLPKMLSFFYTQTIGAIVASQWKRALTYTVPASYSGYLIRYTSFQAEAAYSRIAALTTMGGLNIVTNVYTSLASYTLPQWTSDLEVDVTQAIGAASNVVVTVGYTNQSGVAGRTGTVTIPKSSIIGTRLSVTLQADDIGVVSIQSASVSPTSSSGAINILGFVQLGYHEDGGTNFMETMYAPGAVGFPSGTVLVLEHQGGTVSKARRFDVLMQLVPEAA